MGAKQSKSNTNSRCEGSKHIDPKRLCDKKNCRNIICDSCCFEGTEQFEGQKFCKTCAMSMSVMENVLGDDFADELLEFEKGLKCENTEECFEVVRVRRDIKTGEISGWKEFYEQV